MDQTPDMYPLMPLPNGGYRARTRLNMVDSDGIFFDGPGRSDILASPGTGESEA
jgi:hypothetical protein